MVNLIELGFTVTEDTREPKVYRPPHPKGISYSQTIHQTFHKSLIKNWHFTPEGISHPVFRENAHHHPHPEGSFYSIFCEKIVVEESFI